MKLGGRSCRILLTEVGGVSNNTSAYTNTWSGQQEGRPGGTLVDVKSSCVDWSTDTTPAGHEGRYGQTNRVDHWWTTRNGNACHGIRHLYCFEQ